MKKLLWILSGAALVLALAAAAVAVRCYWSAARDGQFAVRTLSAMPDGRVPVGENVAFRIPVLVPWGQELREMTVAGSPGTVVSGEPAIAETRWERAGREAVIAVTVKAVRAGQVEPGLLKLTVARPTFRNGAKILEETVKLPAVEAFVPELPADAKLPVAGAIAPGEPSAPRRYVRIVAAAVAAVLLGIAAVVWMLSRRRRSEPAPEPWEVAARALADLRGEAHTGSRSAAWCVARLTDVIRDYLSARFQLPFSRQTTGEFLHSLNRPESPLTLRQGRELGDFLTAADLVKFAGETPDRGYLDHAIDQAENLVAETRPQVTDDASESAEKEN